MPTLRNMIDGRTLIAASPAAKKVADQVQDPFGETKDGIDELNEAQLRYEQAKSKHAMSLMPAKKIIDGIDQQHGLGLNSPDSNMGYTDPNQQQIDPMTGLPIPPKPPMPGQSPFGQANLNNKMMPSGQSPAMPGTPGQAPGPQQSAVPGKMGMPTPGAPGVPNPMGGGKPQPGAPGSPQATPASGTTTPKKPGSGASKGKGDDKKGSSKVKVEVHADRNVSPSATNLASAMATHSLRSCDMKNSEMDAGGPGSGRKPGGGTGKQTTKKKDDPYKRKPWTSEYNDLEAGDEEMIKAPAGKVTAGGPGSGRHAGDKGVAEYTERRMSPDTGGEPTRKSKGPAFPAADKKRNYLSDYE